MPYHVDKIHFPSLDPFCKGAGAELGVDGDQDPERARDERRPRAGDPLGLPVDVPQRLHALLAAATHHGQEAAQVRTEETAPISKH